MKYVRYSILSALMFLFYSCGEDRSGEFYALIEDRMWIEEVMRQNYLWYQEIPAIEDEEEYFQEPATFFKNMLYKEAFDGKGDNYSYMTETEITEEESRSLERASTYGIEFELTNDPTGTTAHTFARILYLLPDSPGEKAGLQRGDWISAINGARLTSDNYHMLKSGEEISLARNRIIQNENGYGWQPVDTISVSPSIRMEINPFYIDSVYQVSGQHIAYLMYNEFATGPKNDGTETEYEEQMKQIFHQFKTQAPDAFILDLRYNPGGYLQCAQTLGSLLAPTSALGKDFINLERNDKADPQTLRYAFSNDCASANLDLKRIYILVSANTASASEALINGLVPYMGKENVILIGEKTEGKNVAMSSFVNETYGLTLWPVVAYVSNAKGEGNYIDGFEPQYVLSERNIISPWYPLGDTNEYLLKNALSLITTGTAPDAPMSDTGTVDVKYSTVAARNTQGIRIH